VAIGLSTWRRPENARVRAMLAMAASYASLFLLLLWEALGGRSVTDPDATTLVSLSIWAAVTIGILAWIGHGSRHAARTGADWLAV
jgi:hypothetical protein